MIPTDSEKMLIRWNTKDPNKIARIRERFDIPSYMTLNGLSPVEIKAEDMEVFTECARRGFFGIIRQKWCKNGGHYIFKSRK